MVAWNEAAELKNAALGRQLALSAFAERERKVRRDFWAIPYRERYIWGATAAMLLILDRTLREAV